MHKGVGRCTDLQSGINSSIEVARTSLVQVLFVDGSQMAAKLSQELHT